MQWCVIPAFSILSVSTSIQSFFNLNLLSPACGMMPLGGKPVVLINSVWVLISEVTLSSASLNKKRTYNSDQIRPERKIKMPAGSFFFQPTHSPQNFTLYCPMEFAIDLRFRNLMNPHNTHSKYFHLLYYSTKDDCNNSVNDINMLQ